jgi:tRNA-dihydrouridine synthase B
MYAGSALRTALVCAFSWPSSRRRRAGYLVRTGWTATTEVRIAQIARTASPRWRAWADAGGSVRGDAGYDTIAAIKQAVGIPVLANGDVDSPQKARQVLEYTKCDGLLIGRAAQGRPWIFREIAHFLATGEELAPPSAGEVCSILIEHLEDLYAFYGELQGVRIARKHLGWYAKDRAENSAFRAIVNRAESAMEQLRLTREYFQLPEAALALAA